MNPEQPLVSVLVPLYNKAPFVEETIRSALAQRYPSIEVIVIDDGSTDGSADVVAAIEDPRLVLIRRENRGANATRNELLGLAHGEFIQYLDADDLIDETKLERQMSAFTDDVDAVACRVRRHGRSHDLMPRLDVDNVVASLAHHGLITVAPLYRRAQLEEVGGWRPDLRASQEYELHLRLALRREWKNLRLLDEPLASYRAVENSTSADDGRLYLEKARSLSDLLDLASGEDVDALALALANACRHLARSGQRDLAIQYMKRARSMSPASLSAFPRRVRWARSPWALIALEPVDHIIKRRRRRGPPAASGDEALRVLWLVPDFPSHDDDPSYVFLLNEARSLASVPGIELLVASFADRPRRVAGIRVVNLKPPTSAIGKVGLILRCARREPKLLWDLLRRPSDSYPLAWRLDAAERTMREFRASVVHSHFAVPEGSAAVDIAHRAGVRSVVSLRGVELNINSARGYGFRLDPVYDARFRNMLTKVDAILTATEGMRRRAMEAGAPPANVLVLRNAVDIYPPSFATPDPRASLGIPAGAIVTLSVGHLIGLKGFQYGVSALSRMTGEGDFHYVIIGEGEAQASLTELSGQLGVSDRLHLLGAEPPLVVRQWMENADVFWFLSETEAFGNVVLEAFAASMRIVASPAGIAPELLTDQLGCCVLRSLDADSVARATLEILKATTSRDILTDIRGDIVGEFNSHKRTEALLAVYEPARPPCPPPLRKMTS